MMWLISTLCGCLESGSLTYVLSPPQVLDKGFDSFAKPSLSVQKHWLLLFPPNVAVIVKIKTKLDTSIRSRFDMNCASQKHF